MQKYVFWAFCLILVYLLIAYYRGTSSVLDAFGRFTGQTILFLQARDSQGRPAPYPASQ